MAWRDIAVHAHQRVHSDISPLACTTDTAVVSADVVNRISLRARYVAQRGDPGTGEPGLAYPAGAVRSAPGRIRQRAYDARDLRKLCNVSDAADALLKIAVERLRLSARAYHRISKIARTIADLDGAMTSSQARERGDSVPEFGSAGVG